MARVIVAAGHENIGAITAERIGQASATRLKGNTGALGREAELFNTPWATALVAQLRDRGIEAVRTGAIFDTAYDTDADLIIVGHCDGNGTRNHAQFCMAAAVETGNPTAATLKQAREFVTAWRAGYPAATGLAADGPVTDRMTGHYSGFYRTRRSPMALVEHCILADADGQRRDTPTPEQAARADAAVIAEFVAEMRMATRVSECRFFEETRHSVCHAFLDYWEAHGGLEQFGLPLTEERTEAIDGRSLTVQYFERARFEFHPEFAGSEHAVLLSDLGRQILKLRGEI